MKEILPHNPESETRYRMKMFSQIVRFGALLQEHAGPDLLERDPETGRMLFGSSVIPSDEELHGQSELWISVVEPGLLECTRETVEYHARKNPWQPDMSDEEDDPFSSIVKSIDTDMASRDERRVFLHYKKGQQPFVTVTQLQERGSDRGISPVQKYALDTADSGFLLLPIHSAVVDKMRSLIRRTDLQSPVRKKLADTFLTEAQQNAKQNTWKQDMMVSYAVGYAQTIDRRIVPCVRLMHTNLRHGAEIIYDRFDITVPLSQTPLADEQAFSRILRSRYTDPWDASRDLTDTIQQWEQRQGIAHRGIKPHPLVSQAYLQLQAGEPDVYGDAETMTLFPGKRTYEYRHDQCDQRTKSSKQPATRSIRENLRDPSSSELAALLQIVV